MEDRRGNFTPFVLTVDGLLQCKASHFVKRLSASLASRWEKPFSDVLAFVHSRLQFASMHSDSMYLRGSRVKWRSGLDLMMALPFNLLFND